MDPSRHSIRQFFSQKASQNFVVDLGLISCKIYCLAVAVKFLYLMLRLFRTFRQESLVVVQHCWSLGSRVMNCQKAVSFSRQVFYEINAIYFQFSQDSLLPLDGSGEKKKRDKSVCYTRVWFRYRFPTPLEIISIEVEINLPSYILHPSPNLLLDAKAISVLNLWHFPFFCI